MIGNRISLSARALKSLICIGLGVSGLASAYLCWYWATANFYLEYRYVWVAASGVTAFFLLRGCYIMFTAVRQKRPYELSFGGRQQH